ncbi:MULTISPECIES: hypothetical protein [Myxococcus]|uniref:hypothetical protein n=1 Tax=Myxococcus TaxID=32 RepID=UPI0015950FF0|nr:MULTISPECIES: hypothetical protein [Myxococcus]NVJ23004.1 hypothetical protein [Myxococcus sp. AM011]
MAAPRRAGTLWLAGWLLVLPVSQSWAQGAPTEASRRVVDRVVAIIEGRVLSLSELEFEARVALVQRGGIQALGAPLDEETLRGALELVINQRVQVLNADRLQAFPAEPSEVEARVEAFRSRIGGPAPLERFLARNDVTLEGLKAILARGLRAERVLDSRIRLRAQVGETEIRRFYEQHAADYPTDYETVRDVIRDKLFRERYAALAVEELAQVRASAQVRRVAPFTREAKR